MHANGYIVTIVRQVLLLVAMVGFLAVQTKFGPFLNPVSNASEWFSRLGYVVFAFFGLIVALHIPKSAQGFSFSQNLIKRITRRMDFSIDIFSPKLDISPTSKHTRRRIWQESISVLLYLTPECMMPNDERPLYTDLKALPVPPYLVHFRGTVGERHAENLKILGEVGGMDYAKGIVQYTGAFADRFNEIRQRIQKEFIGPDCYWRDTEREVAGGCFGSAWWIPFPPTLVMKYDSGQTIALRTFDEFQDYVRQNEDKEVCQRRNIRLALRSLDGQVVRWPYTYIQNVGKRFSVFDKGYSAHSTIHFESGVFTIQRNGTLVWKTIDLGSGFNVKLTYDKNVQVDGSVIGLTSDFQLTPILARFLSLNQRLIRERTMSAEALIDDYRHSLQTESQSKIDSLSYQFLCSVYGSPKDMHKLTDVLSEERNIKLREMFIENESAIVAANERLMIVSRSEAETWWYLFWDDLWRRNNATVSNLKTHATDFDPSYPSSIAYRLLPRAALESFLIQRGLMSKKGSWRDFMHSGILNKIYFRLNQIIFKGSPNNAIHYHLGNNPAEIDLENFTLSRHIRSSTLGTGGGTDHDDSQIRARPMYKWEAIFDDPLTTSGKPHRRWLPKLATWFGLDPHWEPNNALSSGISLDVVLEDGNYVLLEHAVHSLKGQMT
ncbi:hypothetical protein Clacol_003027 [Clathrus columnatus]|uniref:Uncharacterized protein n=1 Tax=Clathrus columnatus TaxID=1419009 RepID=A0AAV5A5R2_9AGAM|nr:hypothetical protein Clacol_003027 [Clathrus columnatus]